MNDNAGSRPPIDNDLSFRQWCEKRYELDTYSGSLVGSFIEDALRDTRMPWDGTCQELYMYLLDTNGAGTLVTEAFFSAWELSGRTVEIDEDEEVTNSCSGEEEDNDKGK